MYFIYFKVVALIYKIAFPKFVKFWEQIAIFRNTNNKKLLFLEIKFGSLINAIRVRLFFSLKATAHVLFHSIINVF